MACATYLNGAKRASRYSPALPQWGGVFTYHSERLNHKGHPHPVLSRSTKGVPALFTASSLPTELEARLHLALATSCCCAMSWASNNRWLWDLLSISAAHHENLRQLHFTGYIY